MSSVHERLRQARTEAGFETAAQAAERHNWGVSGYTHHENGTRGVNPEKAKIYARAFKKPVDWLLYGTVSRKEEPRRAPHTVPLVGYVAAGARAHFFDDVQDAQEQIPAPSDASEDTVAVEVRGESLGPAFERAIVFYDDIRNPVTDDLVGELCVVHLEDGRIMVKILQRSKGRRGLFHLLSNNPAEPPILDAEVDWAARVLGVRLPRR